MPPETAPKSGAPLRWGIIGAGGIARDFAAGLAGASDAVLAAVATRGPATDALAQAFPGARIVSGYDALLADPDVDAVYVATPHPGHVQWAIRAAEAGKAVVVEKPLGVNVAEAQAAFEAARRAGTFMMEAFMYRFHPQIARVLELVRSGAVGEVRLIQASFGFAMAFRAEHRLYADELAGGGILDVGCYPVSASRLIAGAAAGQPFLDPVKVAGVGRLAPTGADAIAAASLVFPNGIVAQVSCGIDLAQENALHVFGTEGRISLPDPWLPGGGRSGGAGVIHVTRSGETRTETVEDQKHLYTHEIEATTRAIRAGRQEIEAPGPSWADTIGNIRTLDAWRAGAGVLYSFERNEARRPPLAGRPVVFGSKGSIPTRAMPGLTREVSVVALGTADIMTMTQEAALLDAYYEAGGMLLDTAWVYGAGRGDRLLGHWLASRGVRGETVLIGKGAHSPLCFPHIITPQLTESLDRLGTDRLDIYMMHRDNEAVPVGEFVDAIDAEVRAGRILSYGFSNWSLARVDAALRYAEANGKAVPTSLSNNFSLAEMLQPVWAGCVSVGDDASKRRLMAGDIGVYAWSSQARGFFTDRAAPDRRENQELVDSWYSDRNFERKRRAAELGARRGRSLNQVALAYCLHQPFPVIPLIGPLAPAELADSLGALDIALTPEEVRWLEA